MLIDKQLAAVCKAAKSGTPYIFLSTDWLFKPPRVEIRNPVDLSFSDIANTMHIDTH